MPFIQYMKPLTVENQTSKVNASIAHYENLLSISSRILPILKTSDGKQITKRIETAVRKALPEYQVSLSNSFTISINVWGNGIDYEKRVSVYLSQTGYSNGILDYAKTVEGVNLDGFKVKIDQLTKGKANIPQYVLRYNTMLQLNKDLVTEAAEDGMEFDFDIATNAKYS
jgi:hypothetical protein